MFKNFMRCSINNLYAKENVDKKARRQNQFQTPQILPSEEILREKGVVIR